MQRTDELGDDHASLGQDALAEEPEAWESWETWLVTSSAVVGVFALFLLGWLVDRFVLH